ncbi:MAG: hypothetical protein RRY40_02185, partial [Oscillospiraceae bacterium]
NVCGPWQIAATGLSFSKNPAWDFWALSSLPTSAIGGITLSTGADLKENNIKATAVKTKRAIIISPVIELTFLRSRLKSIFSPYMYPTSGYRM